MSESRSQMEPRARKMRTEGTHNAQERGENIYRDSVRIEVKFVYTGEGRNKTWYPDIVTRCRSMKRMKGCLEVICQNLAHRLEDENKKRQNADEVDINIQSLIRLHCESIGCDEQFVHSRTSICDVHLVLNFVQPHSKKRTFHRPHPTSFVCTLKP